MTTTKKGTPRVVRTLRNAAARSRAEATPGRARALSVRVPTIPYKPSIQGAQADGLLNYPAWKSDLKVMAPIFLGAKTGDLYYLKVGDGDDSYWDTEVELVDPVPGGEVELTLPKTILDTLSEAKLGEDKDGHNLAFTVVTSPGWDEFRSESTRLIIDRTPAGGDLLPRIDFDEDIIKNGLSVAKLEELGGYLQGIIPSYEYQAHDDRIHLYMKLASEDTAVDAGEIFTSTDSGSTTVVFDEETLRTIPGGGTVSFYYSVLDRAGNERLKEGLSEYSPATNIEMLIDGAPDSLLPPVIPEAALDGLIVDDEARPAVTVEIPAYTTPEAGDVIELHFGKNDMTLPALQSADLVNDPLLSVEVPYEDVWQTDEKDAPVFPVTVNYDVFRLDFPHRSGDTNINVDLSLPGGPDPDPETPFNENLPLPVLKGATGSEDNVITPPDSVVEAKVIIAGKNLAEPPADAFAAGDEITLIWSGTEVDTITVDAADVGNDLEVVITPDVMDDHHGSSDLWYKASRTLTEGGPNVALSKAQQVSVQSSGQLPGGGTLDAVKWVEGKTLFPPGKDDAINHTKATTPPDRGTPVRIYEYTNMAVGDLVTFAFAGYKGKLPKPDEPNDPSIPIPESNYEATYTVTAADLVPKPDELTGASATFFDIDILQANLLQIIAGWGSFDFTITNGYGVSTGAQSRIVIDCTAPT